MGGGEGGEGGEGGGEGGEGGEGGGELRVRLRVRVRVRARVRVRVRIRCSTRRRARCVGSLGRDRPHPHRMPRASTASSRSPLAPWPAPLRVAVPPSFHRAYAGATPKPSADLVPEVGAGATASRKSISDTTRLRPRRSRYQPQALVVCCSRPFSNERRKRSR